VGLPSTAGCGAGNGNIRQVRPVFLPEPAHAGWSKTMADLFWLFATAGGAVILGMAIAYALLTRRRLTRSEQRAQDRKVDQLYSEPED